MRVTVEHTIPERAVTRFYSLYLAAFGPLRTRAAARHLLTFEEFAAEMADERVDKYVVWDAGDEPIGLTTLTTDLTAVPWISPDYFAVRYPEEYARGAVYYLGLTLVDPARGRIAFALMIKRIVRRLTEAGAVCAYDVCAYNDAHSLGKSLARVFLSRDSHVDAVDVQTYYAASFGAAARKRRSATDPGGSVSRATVRAATVAAASARTGSAGTGPDRYDPREPAGAGWRGGTA